MGTRKAGEAKGREAGERGGTEGGSSEAEKEKVTGEAEGQSERAEEKVQEMEQKTAESEPEIAGAGVEEGAPITVEAQLVQEKETPAAAGEGRRTGAAGCLWPGAENG